MTKGALDLLFRSELKTFVSHIGKQPVPEAQDLRAGVLAFVATFAPEALSDTATELLSDSVKQLRASPSYSSFEWFRLPYLDAARANLFDDPATLEVVVRNLSHGLNRPGFTGGQNSRRIAHYGTVIQQEELEAVFT